ncbi:MAG: flagellum-specific ATP synthase [Planctomycetota bacterium]|jgi:flagellum-specific ATP synthase
MFDIEQMKHTVKRGARPYYQGRVRRVTGVLVEASGIPVPQGGMVRIERGALGPIDAEAVGFDGNTTLLMPHGDVAGIAPDQLVISLEREFTVPTSNALLGRVLDGFGYPMDSGPELPRTDTRPARAQAPLPRERRPIDTPLTTGVRAVDGLLTLGKGQRLGIFAGSGVGKSTLLGQITRGTDADVIVVCLVGERGREVQDFLEEVLGEEGRKRSVLVAATSDRPPIERLSAPFTAVTIAEAFRDQGLDVLLVMDSVTRYAAASREVGLAVGEPPTVRGYPPSFFASVPKLLERMGRTEKGSITGLITVLLEGDDHNEPVADTLRGLLDGHLVLSRDLAQAGHFPAVDVLSSLSRLMNGLANEGHIAHSRALRADLAAYQEGRDLIDIGAYQAGANPALDRAVMRMPVIEAFLRQETTDMTPLRDTLEMLGMVATAGDEPG